VGKDGRDRTFSDKSERRERSHGTNGVSKGPSVGLLGPPKTALGFLHRFHTKCSIPWTDSCSSTPGKAVSRPF